MRKMTSEEFVSQLKKELPDFTVTLKEWYRDKKIQIWDIDNGKRTIGFLLGPVLLSGIKDGDIARWAIEIREVLK